MQQKCEILDNQNMDKVSVCRILLLQPTPKLGRTKPSTGPHAGRGLDTAVLDNCIRLLLQAR